MYVPYYCIGHHGTQLPLGHNRNEDLPQNVADYLEEIEREVYNELQLSPQPEDHYSGQSDHLGK